MKDAPKTIYLQVCEENECDSEFSEHEGITWCEDKINDSDIEYTRSDISQQRTWERPWVSLTDEDKALCVQATAKRGSTYELMAAIEAKLKEKNT